MKKSLINYGIPIALMLAALLAGCAQPTDSDSGGGGNVPRYDEIRAIDVFTIAAAFEAGQNPVYPEKDITLGNQELIVPRGKTLDFVVNNKHIASGGIGNFTKIILAGDINLPDGENYIRLTEPTQKFVATKANLTKYAEVMRPGGEASAYPFDTVLAFTDDSKKFKITTDNVVVIQDWDGLETTFRDLGAEAKTYYDGYLALEVPTVGDGYISPSALEIIGKYTNQLRIYILNSVKAPDMNIYLTGGGEDILPLTTNIRSASSTPLFSVDGGGGGDPAGEIVIAGGLYLNKSYITLADGIPMSVKGPLAALSDDTSGNPLISGGSVTVYNANFGDTAKATFAVKSIDFASSTLTNKFGDSVAFTGKGAVKISGPAEIKLAEFQGPAILAGKVTTKAGANLTFKDKAEIIGGMDIGLNTTVAASTESGKEVIISGNITGDSRSWDTISKTPGVTPENVVNDTDTPVEPGPVLDTITLTKDNFDPSTGNYVVDKKDAILDLGVFNILIDLDEMTTIPKFVMGGTLQGGIKVLANTLPEEDWQVIFTNGGFITVKTGELIDNTYINFDDVQKWIIQDKFPSFAESMEFKTPVEIGKSGEDLSINVAADVSFTDVGSLTAYQPVKFTNQAGVKLFDNSNFEKRVEFTGPVTISKASANNGGTFSAGGAFNASLEIEENAMVVFGPDEAPTKPLTFTFASLTADIGSSIIFINDTAASYTGDVEINGNAEFAGVATVGGNVKIEGEVKFGGAADVTGNLTTSEDSVVEFTKAVTVNGDVTIGSLAIFADAATFGGDVAVGNEDVGHKLGKATFAGKTTFVVSKTLSVGSAAKVFVEADVGATLPEHISVEKFGSLSANGTPKVGLLNNKTSGGSILLWQDTYPIELDLGNAFKVSRGTLELGEDTWLDNLTTNDTFTLGTDVAVFFKQDAGSVSFPVYKLGGAAGTLISTSNPIVFSQNAITGSTGPTPTLTFGVDKVFISVGNNAEATETVTVKDAIISLAKGSISFAPQTALHITGAGSLTTTSDGEGSRAVTGYIVSATNTMGGSLFAGTTALGLITGDSAMIGTTSSNFITSESNLWGAGTQWVTGGVWSMPNIGEAESLKNSGSIAVFAE
ncbi:MAG: hypothetical protein LBC27_01685 [Spirochaetaceae bacterium]|nr:hypothetical protein [Spirochaetaceae bacterium]